MKIRCFSVLLAAYMLFGLLTACGAQPSVESPTPPQSTTSAPESSTPQPSHTPSIHPQGESAPPTASEEPSAPPQSSQEPEPSPEPEPSSEPEPTVTVKESSFKVDPSVFGRERIWRFNMEVINDTNSVLTLTAARIDRCLGQNLVHQYITSADKLASNFPATLSPGESFQYKDSHPAEKEYDRMVYIFVFRDANGNEVQYHITFHVTMNMPPRVDIAKDNTDGYPVIYPKDSAFGTRWEFGLRVENNTGGTLTLKDITRVRYFGGKNGDVAETKVLKPSQLPDDSMKSIPTGKSGVFQDNSPNTSYYDFVRYTLVFVTEQGKEVEYVFHFYVSD